MSSRQLEEMNTQIEKMHRDIEEVEKGPTSG